jgi:predicted lipoprotein with Yx(FWY)xxD motif
MRTTTYLTPFLVIGMVAAACAGATPTSAPTGTPAATQEASPTPTATATEGATEGATEEATDAGETPSGTGAAVTVELAESDLGQILVDAEGMTLYGFVPDEADGEPTCYDDCAAAWPPLTVDDGFAVGEGLSEDDFTTAERTDGGVQLKLGTYPLYYFADDEAPGDTNGQGLNDVWFVIGADGELIRET